ncbi:hypothetical protein [Streptomyces luteireticuli]|uniref:hypothetical protein n=1 Tax=Streptomyces luteireticuli TaxID=173858 RepID=UPI0035585924
MRRNAGRAASVVIGIVAIIGLVTSAASAAPDPDSGLLDNAVVGAGQTVSQVPVAALKIIKDLD